MEGNPQSPCSDVALFREVCEKCIVREKHVGEKRVVQTEREDEDESHYVGGMR